MWHNRPVTAKNGMLATGSRAYNGVAGRPL
jgi:hypothetical protein